MDPQQTEQALDVMREVEAVVIEHLAFIETCCIELSTDALETLAMNPAVLHVGFEGYYPIIKGIEHVVQKRTEYQIRVANISLGPFPPHQAKPFVENDPVNLATKSASEQGIVVVVAAGNQGPKNGTMNPWAAAPWVIAVGAAVDEKTLADFSSRGDPNDSLHIPTLVARGVDIKFEDETLSGTSFAAAKTSFLACVCIEFIETLQSFIGKNRSSLVVGGEHAIALIDTGIDESRMPLSRRRRLRGGRARVLSKSEFDKLIKLQEFLSHRRIPYVVSATPETVKKMLQSIATPMQKELHEVGAGFVDDNAAIRYMSSFGARSFVRLFAQRNIERDEVEELDRLDQAFGPFFTKKQSEGILNFVDLTLGIVDCRVA